MQFVIRIQGHLQDHWFEDLTMERLNDNTTAISGDYIDQASLFGILKRIRDLGIELISVNRPGVN